MNPADLPFETTASLPAPRRMVGQARAEEAMALALGIQDSHYNLFVAGRPGTGRREAVMELLDVAASALPAAQDWCYVHNFEQPEEPRAVALPAGMGKAFAQDVASYVRACRGAFQRTFTEPSYQRERQSILRVLREQRGRLLDTVRAQARDLGFTLRETQDDIAVLARKPHGAAPATAHGFPPSDATPNAPDEDADDADVYSREELSALPAPEREAIRERQARVEMALDDVAAQVHAAENVARAQLRTLSRAAAERTLATASDAIATRFAVSADAVEFLKHLRVDLVTHAGVLRADILPDATGEHAGGSPSGTATDADALGTDDTDDEMASAESGEDADARDGDDDQSGAEEAQVRALLRQYRVNVLVTHRPGDHAPIVEETTPSQVHLLGRIDIASRRGATYTDHMMIKAGALHRANGGFLILHARDVLMHSRAWETVKQVMRFGTIKTESTPETGAPLGATLRPEPIAAAIKVIIIGSTGNYNSLIDQHREFREFFKVRADFDDRIPRTRANELAYAQFAGQVARNGGEPPLTRDAVALLIEEGSRWVGNQERLSAVFGEVRDVTAEACYWARQDHSAVTTRTHIGRAVMGRERRARLLADRMHDLMANDVLAVATTGAVVGQVNGLAVTTLIDYEFGYPLRITARTAPGLGGVIDIERETDLGGPTHSKGVLILSGYLLGRYAQEAPLGLAATLCMEQNYTEIDGDSASSAELYALLSSLANAPIRQGIAVTGSVNQRGEVQSIGGVTLKIEGFFDLCAERGLTGEQGVIIPHSNLRNLMLKEPIVEAVRAGKFHIYAVSTIDEGLEILTGTPAGTAQGDTGAYLTGTLNDRILQTLRTYAERIRAMGLAPAYVNRMAQ